MTRSERKTMELPPSQKPIPLGFQERRKEERSAYAHLRQWLLEIVNGYGTDSEKINAIKIILLNVEKNELVNNQQGE